MTYQTTEAQADAETRCATAAAAMLAGERWAARPDTRAMFELMRMAHDEPSDSYRGWASYELARPADDAESRAVLAAVLARRVDE